MKSQKSKGKQPEKPYSKPRMPRAELPLTPPETDSNSSSPRIAPIIHLGSSYTQWTHDHSATVEHPEEMQALSIPGFHGRNSICSVRDPRDLSPINLRSFARGNALGGNNTCFTGYEELREVLTATFGNAEGSYLVKINEAFDRYCEITANNQDKKKGSAKEEIRADNNLDKKEIDWSSSVFVEYLCFLLSYFVPRKAFGLAKSTSAQAFGQEVSRDKVIEYLLSLCTGVIFSRKTISSHCQTVRKAFGQDRTDIPESAVLLSMKHGFEGDFPDMTNPMGADLAWMHNYATLGGTRERCPLILPPVLAVILEPARSVNDVNWKRMRSSFVFSTGNIPAIIPKHWEEYLEATRGKKKATPKVKALVSTEVTTSSKEKHNSSPAISYEQNMPGMTETADTDMDMDFDEDTSSETTHTSPGSRQLPGVSHHRGLRLYLGSGRRSIEERQMHQAATILYEMRYGLPYTGPLPESGSSPRADSDCLSTTEPAANAEAGPGPSTMARRVKFARGTK